MDAAQRRPGPFHRRVLAVGGALLALLLWPGAVSGTGAARPATAAIGTFPGGAAGAGTAAAQERSWDIESFRSEIVVRPDAVVEVTETIRPRFRGSFNGIYRRIPVEYRTPSGFSHELRLEVLRVTDGDGEPLRYELSRPGDYRQVKVWIPGAEDTVKTVEIRYRSHNALKFFEDYQELYWNVTGTEWPVPIHEARADILLPEGVTGTRVRAYAGEAGTQEEFAETERDGRRIAVRSTRSLGYGEGLTVAVAWDPGVVSPPGLVRRAGYFVRDNWPLGLPLLALALMFPLWYRHGRDPETGAVSARYEPPEGLTPGGVGVLIDHSPDMRDVTATIVDLAVKGYIRIEEEEEEKFFGLTSERDYVFELLRDREGWDDLRPHELVLLEGLFAGRERYVRMSDLEDEFYKELPDIRDAMMDLLVTRGFFNRRPDEVKKFWTGIAVLVAGAGGVAAGFLGWSLGASPLSLLLGGLATAVVVALFGRLMPVRTASGTRALTSLLGFEEFLSRVETDRYRRMITGPEMFEELLPYAMALGVEKKWAAAFEDMAIEPPEWYSGAESGSFHPGGLASDLGRLNTTAASAMTSSPRSSGGSGFSGGGGSVGGGVGGGGGGAF